MGVKTHISYQQEQNRLEAVLEPRAMVLKAELGRLQEKRTYTTEQVYNQICRHLEKKKSNI